MNIAQVFFNFFRNIIFIFFKLKGFLYIFLFAKSIMLSLKLFDTIKIMGLVKILIYPIYDEAWRYFP
jgi:hypothetical protein